jgi:hypothetical protein
MSASGEGAGKKLYPGDVVFDAAGKATGIALKCTKDGKTEVFPVEDFEIPFGGPEAGKSAAAARALDAAMQGEQSKIYQNFMKKMEEEILKGIAIPKSVYDGTVVPISTASEVKKPNKWFQPPKKPKLDAMTAGLKSLGEVMEETGFSMQEYIKAVGLYGPKIPKAAPQLPAQTVPLAPPAELVQAVNDYCHDHGILEQTHPEAWQWSTEYYYSSDDETANVVTQHGRFGLRRPAFDDAGWRVTTCQLTFSNTYTPPASGTLVTLPSGSDLQTFSKPTLGRPFGEPPPTKAPEWHKHAHRPGRKLDLR